MINKNLVLCIFVMLFFIFTSCRSKLLTTKDLQGYSYNSYGNIQFRFGMQSGTTCPKRSGIILVKSNSNSTLETVSNMNSGSGKATIKNSEVIYKDIIRIPEGTSGIFNAKLGEILNIDFGEGVYLNFKPDRDGEYKLSFQNSRSKTVIVRGEEYKAESTGDCSLSFYGLKADIHTSLEKEIKQIEQEKILQGKKVDG